MKDIFDNELNDYLEEEIHRCPVYDNETKIEGYPCSYKCVIADGR